ncbi:hypothetical protein BDW74DRAFT_104506 [Aspergillus multicolor]|uniref:uncharacterized protein n=1 Tax=Aspergillus multicolor TaxID=41759 RepID=UPI003CCD3BF9
MEAFSLYGEGRFFQDILMPFNMAFHLRTRIYVQFHHIHHVRAADIPRRGLRYDHLTPMTTLNARSLLPICPSDDLFAVLVQLCAYNSGPARQSIAASATRPAEFLVFQHGADGEITFSPYQRHLISIGWSRYRYCATSIPEQIVRAVDGN